MDSGKLLTIIGNVLTKMMGQGNLQWTNIPWIKSWGVCINNQWRWSHELAPPILQIGTHFDQCTYRMWIATYIVLFGFDRSKCLIGNKCSCKFNDVNKPLIIKGAFYSHIQPVKSTLLLKLYVQYMYALKHTIHVQCTKERETESRKPLI